MSIRKMAMPKQETPTPSEKTWHCEGSARPFLLANSHGFGRGVVRLCPNACRPSVWGKLGNSLGLGGFRTRHIRSDSDDPKARGPTCNGKAARLSGLVACQLLCHRRSGFQLGLRISVVLSTIRFFLRSSRWYDGADFSVLRRHRTCGSSLNWGKLAEGPAGLRSCARRSGHDCLKVGSTSVSAESGSWISHIPFQSLNWPVAVAVNAVTGDVES